MKAEWKIDPPKDRAILAVIVDHDIAFGKGAEYRTVERVAIVVWSNPHKGFVLDMSEASEYEPETYPVLRWDEVPGL